LLLLCVWSALFPADVYATNDLSPLSLHDALPISTPDQRAALEARAAEALLEDGADDARLLEQAALRMEAAGEPERASENYERARSEEHTSELSHVKISYAVFCLKKKKNKPHSSRK